jgi:citrate lyase beta subunit
MLGEAMSTRLDALLGGDDAARALRYPGTMPGRQPVHTVYLPADRYHAGVVDEWGTAAIDVLEEHGPLPGFDSGTHSGLEQLVHEKLGDEPIEDLRIDFEDGYGVRSDAEEDGHARAAAVALMASVGDRRAPLAIGLRIKSLEGATRRRSVRTLDVFLDALFAAGSPTADAPLPEGFRLTLPKVTSVAQVMAMVELCRAFEREYSLPDGRLRFEIQVETPQAVLGADGAATVARMVHAADSRCAGLHYGTYDYSAAVGIAAALQSMEHPAADHAKAVMQVAAAGTGVPLSDGSTNILPIGSRAEVRAGWALHARLVRRSLERGFYQGWDLHPAQLPTRFAATFAFYLDGLPAAASRLRHYLDRSESGILDEPATAAALAGYLTRGLDCGAFTDEQVSRQCALDREDLDKLAHSRDHQRYNPGS